jgi:parvulin-like peptidyl-prolyl isomerase
LDTVSKALSLPIGRTGGVQEGPRVQVGNLVVPDAGAWAFGGSKPGATSPVIETSFAFYIFRLDSMQAAGVPPLAQVRPAVEYALRSDKKKALAKPKAEEYMKRLEKGESMAEAAKAMNLPHREFGPFTRVNPPLTDPMVVGTAFGLEKGQRSGLLDTPDGLYVMESLEKVPADSAKFVKELDEYRTKMIDLARQARVRGYMAALRQSAKIVDNRAKLRQQQEEAAETRQPPVT